jgi:general secretion pathway protein A
MYLEFFKFKKSPFHITPDPDFLFLSPSHKEASASIFYGIEKRKGFVSVTGEVGVGKTTILRSYLEGTDPEKIKIVYIFNAALSFDKLLKQICSELGVQVTDEDPEELSMQLFHFLIDQYDKGRNVVLIIDEAQNIPVETLERLRMLSNLETSQDKLIQIILVGQPEFETKLDLPELRQLKQRMAIRSRIEPLTAEEGVAYIQHRLMRASAFHNPVFTQKALKLIIKEAKGIPRTMNILCDNALVTAFGYQRKPVDHKIVKEVIGDFRERKPGLSWRRKTIWVPALGVCFAAAVWTSSSILSRFEAPPFFKQSSRPVEPQQPPAAVKSGQGAPVRPVGPVAVPEPAPAASVKLSGHSADGEKKVPAATSVSPGAAITAKPESSPAVQDKTVSTGSTPAGKNGSAAASVLPVVADSPKGQSPPSTPAVPSTTAAGRTPAPSPKAVASLEPPAKLPSPPKDPLAAATPQKAQPASSLIVKKGDSVSKLLVDIYGRVDDEMLEAFKHLNPNVRNINKIEVGKKVFLPPAPPAEQ